MYKDAEARGWEMHLSRIDSLNAFVNEARFRMVMFDNDHRILAISDVVLAELGRDRDDVVGRSAGEVFGATPDRDWGKLAQSGVFILPPQKIQSTLGPRWMQNEGAAWRNEAGEIGGIITIAHDVTAEQEAVQELCRTEALLHAVVESIPSIVTVHNIDMNSVALVNKASQDFFRVQTGEDLPAGKPDGMRDEDASAHRRGVEEAIRAGGHTVNEEQVADANGQIRDLKVVRRIIEPEGSEKHVLVVAEDVTEQKRAAEALKAALAEAESANRAKSAFLATVSHEIRTPLNGVLGMAQAMARDELPPVQRHRLEVIRQSGEALLAILNDVLDLTKIESGKLELESIAFDLGQVIRSAAASFVAPSVAKGLDLVVDVPDVEGYYQGDPTRVRQVLSNLLSNAVKFTDTGEVRVTGAIAADGVVLTVSDTGPGIAPATLERVFEKFVQADSSTTRRYGGSGLGLPICRELAQLMGGTITAVSTPGKGAQFSIALPLQRLAAPAVAEPVAAAPDEFQAPQELHILAAEDNPVNQQVLKTIFDQVGVPLTIVPDGAAAVQAFQSRSWDIVLMDVQMPVLDGVAATEQIRSIEAGRGDARTPIIALTANVMQHQKAGYLESGMDEVVAKPLQIAELFGAIERLVQARAESADSKAA